MKNITFTTGEPRQEKTSAWLVAFVQFAQKIEALELLGRVKVKMKEVRYTVHQKVIALMLSVVAGCEYTSDINQKLVPDTVIAETIDMPRFPDQSQINELIRAMSEENIEQLKGVHHELFMQNARCLSDTGNIVVDVDQPEFIANGKKYELAQKGYFSKKKNQKGYQLSAAFCGGEKREPISLYLDPGNSHCSSRFEDLVNDILAKLSPIARENRLIIRFDSGYGSDENIKKIKAKVKFVGKAYSTARAYTT